MKNQKITNLENQNLFGTSKHNEKKGYSDKLSKTDRKAKTQLRKFKKNNFSVDSE